jgi:replicative DNA helicase
MSTPASRVPPQDLHAETTFLASILEKPECLDDVIGSISAGDFYRDLHRRVFEAMCALSDRREPIDPVTVAGELRRLDPKSELQAPDLFLTFNVGSSNPGHYAKIIREKANLRRTIETMSSTVTLCYEQHGDIPQFLDVVQQRIMDATSDHSHRGGPKGIREVVAETFKQIEADSERETTVTGLESGLVDLDRMTTGWQPGDLIILAARPSVGKTACGMGFVQHVAFRLAKPALVFSMEMTEKALGKRILSSETGVDLQRIRVGRLKDDEWNKLAQAAGTLAQAPLDIDETRGLSAMDIRARARRVARKRKSEGRPLSLILVDYLGLMRTEENNETVSARVGKNALRLKELAGDLQLPVILLAQLNRDSAKGDRPRRPVLADLRDSGEIEQHADVVVFIHREVGEHEIIVEKQRNGPLGNVKVGFQAECTRFYNLRDGFVQSGEAA